MNAFFFISVRKFKNAYLCGHYKFKYYEKSIDTIVLAMLCLASCEKSTQKNDLAELKLNGKVKSIRKIPYKAVEKFGEVVKGDALDRFGENLQITFNDKGNKIEENLFNSDGRLSFKLTYKYDNKGNKIESNSFDPDRRLSSKSTYKYDDKGNKIEQNFFNSDGSLSFKYTYKYDDKGNQIEENWFGSNVSSSFKHTYKYDDKGNQIEQNYFDPDGRLSLKYTYKYDDKGNQIEENSFISDGNLDDKYTYKYTYDQQGNWIQQIAYKVKNGVEKPSRIVERTIEYY